MNETQFDGRGHFTNARFVHSLPRCTHRRWIPGGLLATVVCAGQAMASLTVNPGSISNAFNGAVVLTITGLNNAGQRVVVEKFFDADNSNTVTAADQLMQRFKVTDGQVSSIGGRRNINVPGDNDGAANSSIQTALNFTPAELPGRVDGRFIFRISPDGAGFAPFTSTLVVTQTDYAGSSISGRVMAGATPQTGALVLITSGSLQEFNVAGVTRTDASGNYSLKMPPGIYRPVPVKTGFVFNLAAASTFTVNTGANTAAGDSALVAGARTISGQVRDDGVSPVALGGMFVYGAGSTGVFSLTFSDASGNYVLNAGAAAVSVGVLEEQARAAGVLAIEEQDVAAPGNATGINLTLPRPTTLIYGNVRTPAAAAVPWVDVRGEYDGPPNLNSTSVTDADGYYTLGAIIGSWNVNSETPGYLVSGRGVDVNTAGTNVLHDITAFPVTAHLRGIVHDNHSQIVANQEILAHDYQGTSSRGVTGADGAFDLPVYGGPGGTSKLWSLQMNQSTENPADYISSRAEFNVTDGASINNINYTAWQVTAHLRGTVRDENNATVSGVNLYATPLPGDILTGSSSQGDGSFDVPVFGGTWRFGLSNNAGPGILGQGNLVVTTTDNADINNLVFKVRHTSTAISGTVKNTQGIPLPGISLSAAVTVSGAEFTTTATTAAGGGYNLAVFSGTWHVEVNAAELAAQGHQPVAAQDVFVNGGSVTVDFTASTAGGGPTFAGWKTTAFTPAEQGDPNVSGPAADPDRDGVPNLMEYALSLQPKTADSAGLPAPGSLTEPGPVRYLTLTFRRLRNAAGLAYNVQEATTLSGPWTTVVAGYEMVASDTATETMRAKTPLSAGTKTYLRLQVVQQ